jgi:hypothetical protein
MSDFINMMNLDVDGIPNLLKMLTNTLCENIQPHMYDQSEDTWNELKSNTYVYLPSISKSNLFNTWFEYYLKSEGYKVINGVTDMNEDESLIEAGRYFLNFPKCLFVDLSNQMVTKYICDASNTIYKSARPVKFENITISLYGEDNLPPWLVSFSTNQINNMMEPTN